MKQILQNHPIHLPTDSVAIILTALDIDTLIMCMELVPLDEDDDKRSALADLLETFQELRKDTNANLDDITDGADDTTSGGAIIPALADEAGRRQTTDSNCPPDPNAVSGGSA